MSPADLIDVCAECLCTDYHGDHLPDCTREECLETCSECGEYYVNTASPYARSCLCEPDTPVGEELP